MNSPNVREGTITENDGKTSIFFITANQKKFYVDLAVQRVSICEFLGEETTQDLKSQWFSTQGIRSDKKIAKFPGVKKCFHKKGDKNKELILIH